MKANDVTVYPAHMRNTVIVVAAPYSTMYSPKVTRLLLSIRRRSDNPKNI